MRRPGRRRVSGPKACVLTIFGASGDLTKRKLIPALDNLALERRLPERFAMVGCARSEMTHEAFRNKMREAVIQFSRTGLEDDPPGSSSPPIFITFKATTIAWRLRATQRLHQGIRQWKSRSTHPRFLSGSAARTLWHGDSTRFTSGSGF